jgi:hypothetical protein
MISKKLIKQEIEKLHDERLEILYKIIKAFEALSHIDTVQPETSMGAIEMHRELKWLEFIEETYGSMAESPIERVEQGVYEIREAIK